MKLKSTSLVVMVIAYIIAGANHFYNPPSYWHIIPSYIPYPHTVNILAGFFELLLAVLLIFKNTRRWAALGIVLMLIAFIPVHIDMILRAPFLLGGSIMVTPLVAWTRLLLQPLLIAWAWWYAKK